jgi:hypothetical protein
MSARLLLDKPGVRWRILPVLGLKLPVNALSLLQARKECTDLPKLSVSFQ